MTIDRNEHLNVIFKITGPVIVLMGFLAFALWYMDRIGGAAALGLFLTSPFLGVGLGLLLSRGTTRAAERIGNLLVANQNLAPAASFSYQESLVARGEPELAREAYESHLALHPDDLDARLALAALWRDQLGNPDRAIDCYLAIRRLNPNPDQEFLIGNALIDLYRSTGQTGRELTELSRFAERFAGTEAGIRAREALRRRKATG